MSAQTSTENLKDLLENKLLKKTSKLYGAPVGKKILFFIDDVNMPLLEQYGAQPPVEFLRQVAEGGFYDTKKLTFKNVKDMIMISACAPPTGGRNPVTPRFFRHFSMIWIPNLN